VTTPLGPSVRRDAPEPSGAPRPEDEEPSFAAWVADTVLRWRTIAATLLLAWLIAVVTMVALPPSYRAAASFSPNLSSSSRLPTSIGALAGAGSLGALASGLGGAAGVPSESPFFYRELLTSREFLTRLLQTRFRNYRTAALGDSATLLDVRNRFTTDRARALEMEIKDLRSDLNIGVDQRANIVSISLDTEWPTLSADVLNRAVQLVNQFNIEQRQTRGHVKRVFLASRVDSPRADLARSSRALRDFYDENRNWKTSPVLSGREQDLRRQQEFAEELYLTTRRDFEAARVNEINDAALITIVDAAVPPVKKQFPRIGITLGVATVAGLSLGLLLAALGAVAADWSRRTPASADRLARALAQARGELRVTVRGLGRASRQG
jgi:uncharacterized protein involved in exopolysaccharide biosynthesis